MKIEDKMERDKFLNSLNCGDVFKLYQNVYMRSHWNVHTSDFKCICLSDGQIHDLSPHTLVRKILNPKLILE